MIKRTSIFSLSEMQRRCEYNPKRTNSSAKTVNNSMTWKMIYHHAGWTRTETMSASIYHDSKPAVHRTGIARRYWFWWFNASRLFWKSSVPCHLAGKGEWHTFRNWISKNYFGTLMGCNMRSRLCWLRNVFSRWLQKLTDRREVFYCERVALNFLQRMSGIAHWRILIHAVAA